LTPSARSANLIAGDGTKNGLSRSEQKTVSTTQNNRLTGKAPYKFESALLQRRVSCEPGFLRQGAENFCSAACGSGARLQLLPAGQQGVYCEPKADRWLQDPSHANLKGGQLAGALEVETWDPSIKSLILIPQILRMMARLREVRPLGDP
jgi:hypothetical protein